MSGSAFALLLFAALLATVRAAENGDPAVAAADQTDEKLIASTSAVALVARFRLQECPPPGCAVKRRRFSVGENPTRQLLQPDATGATVEVTKRLKPSVKLSRNMVTARVCRP